MEAHVESFGSYMSATCVAAGKVICFHSKTLINQSLEYPPSLPPPPLGSSSTMFVTICLLFLKTTQSCPYCSIASFLLGNHISWKNHLCVGPRIINNASLVHSWLRNITILYHKTLLTRASFNPQSLSLPLPRPTATTSSS